MCSDSYRVAASLLSCGVTIDVEAETLRCLRLIVDHFFSFIIIMSIGTCVPIETNILRRGEVYKT